MLNRTTFSNLRRDPRTNRLVMTGPFDSPLLDWMFGTKGKRRVLKHNLLARSGYDQGASTPSFNHQAYGGGYAGISSPGTNVGSPYYGQEAGFDQYGSGYPGQALNMPTPMSGNTHYTPNGTPVGYTDGSSSQPFYSPVYNQYSPQVPGHYPQSVPQAQTSYDNDNHGSQTGDVEDQPTPVPDNLNSMSGALQPDSDTTQQDCSEDGPWTAEQDDTIMRMKDLEHIGFGKIAQAVGASKKLVSQRYHELKNAGTTVQNEANIGKQREKKQQEKSAKGHSQKVNHNHSHDHNHDHDQEYDHENNHQQHDRHHKHKNHHHHDDNHNGKQKQKHKKHHGHEKTKHAPKTPATDKFSDDIYDNRKKVSWLSPISSAASSPSIFSSHHSRRVDSPREEDDTFEVSFTPNECQLLTSLLQAYHNALWPNISHKFYDLRGWTPGPRSLKMRYSDHDDDNSEVTDSDASSDYEEREMQQQDLDVLEKLVTKAVKNVYKGITGQFCDNTGRKVHWRDVRMLLEDIMDN